MEELHDLRSAWGELAKIWEQIYELKEKPWISIVPRKIRQSLDGLLQQLKNLPTKLRQYAAYDHLQRVLKGYTKVRVYCCIRNNFRGSYILQNLLCKLAETINPQWLKGTMSVINLIISKARILLLPRYLYLRPSKIAVY